MSSFQSGRRRPLRRWLAVVPGAAACVAAATCSDRPAVAPRTDVTGHAALSVSPSFATLPLGGPVIPLSALRAVLTAENGDTFQKEAQFTGDSAIFTIDVPVTGGPSRFALSVSALDDRGEVAYAGNQQLRLHAGNNPAPSLALAYAGPDANVRVIHIAPTPAIVPALAKTTLSATGADADGKAVPSLRVGWTIRDTSVATVDASGVVTGGRSQGSTVIVARSATGIADSVILQVHAPVDRIIPAATALTIPRGNTQTVAAEMRDATNHLIDDRKPSWSSSDTTVATITPAGALTAKKIGRVVLTATAEGKSASVSVTVVTPVDHIELAPDTVRFSSLGATFKLGTTLVPIPSASVAGLVPKYTSSAQSVVTVDTTGTIRATGNGSAKVTATLDDRSAEVEVVVQQVAASSSVSPHAANVDSVGGTVSFTAVFRDARGNKIIAPVVTWSSSDQSVATVTGTGVTATVVARRSGSTVITATSDGKSDAAGFFVAPTIASLRLTPEKTQIQTGEISTLSAEFFDATGTLLGDAPAKFTLSPQGIASVFGNALVGVLPGTAHVVASAGSFTAATDITILAPSTRGGGDMVVLSDMNAFDNSNGVAAGGENQKTFFRNLVNFTGTGPRAAKTGVMVFRGHASLCDQPASVPNADVECSPANYSQMSATLVAAGFNVVDVTSASATLDQPIDASIKVIFLLAPSTPFSTSEVDLLKQFSNEGGRVIFVSDHGDFYGTYVRSVENPFFVAMGAAIRANDSVWSCGESTPKFAIPGTSIRPHQITAGLTGLQIPCSSDMVPGPLDFALIYDAGGTQVLAAVAQFDRTTNAINRVRRASLAMPRVSAPVSPSVTGTNTPRRKP